MYSDLLTQVASDSYLQTALLAFFVLTASLVGGLGRTITLMLGSTQVLRLFGILAFAGNTAGIFH